MFTIAALAPVALSGLLGAADAAFLVRVENAPLMTASGTPVPRVERDAGGSVVKLHLNNMRLTADEFAAVGRIKSLRTLNLYRTNATDADVGRIRALPRLEGLNLTSTD